MVENLLERLLIFDINSFKPSIHTLFPTVFYDTYLVGVFTFLPEYLTCDTIKFWSNYRHIGRRLEYSLFISWNDGRDSSVIGVSTFFFKPVVVKRVNSKHVISPES